MLKIIVVIFNFVEEKAALMNSKTKTLRIGPVVKRIELGNDNMAALQIGDVLRDYRDRLIRSLLSDLHAYLSYTFAVPATKAQVEEIRSRLNELRHAGISLVRYGEIVEEILANDS